MHSMLHQLGYWVDRSIPYTLYRWLFFAFAMLLFMLRVLLYQGFYVICYGLWIFLLNAFLAFLTPMHDPEDDVSNDVPLSSESTSLEPSLDGSGSEFRPFQRRLPEFQFWWMAIRSTLASLLLSMFSVMDIPVYWPILVVYFIGLSIVTLKRQISHMIKYRYIPFDFGKARF